MDERVDSDGAVVTPLSEEDVGAALDRIEEDGAESVAVCFLHSYRNPGHERRVGEAIRERLPDTYVSLSVDVLPEIREYERTSTTVVNSYLGPIIKNVPGLAHGPARRDGYFGAGAHHAVQRRHHVGEAGGRDACEDRRVRAGGGRRGRRRDRQEGGSAEPDHLRHGRDDRQGVADRGRPTELDHGARDRRGHIAVQPSRQGGRPRHQGAGDGPRGGRRRRRQHRVDRPRRRAQSWAPERRGDARAGLLRHGRH